MFLSRQCRTRNEKEKVKLVHSTRQLRKNKNKIPKLCKENQTECLIIGDIETLSKSIGKVNKAQLE